MASKTAVTSKNAKRKFENGKKKPKTLKDEFGEPIDVKPMVPKKPDEYDYDSSDEEVREHRNYRFPSKNPKKFTNFRKKLKKNSGSAKYNRKHSNQVVR